MTNSTSAENLLFGIQVFYTYSTCIIFGLGLIGNILNILLFTRLKLFQLNRCAFYLIVESVINIIQINQLFAGEIWKISINRVDPMNISLIWCKLRTMIQQWSRLMLASIVCFTAFDQFLCTNHLAYLRKLSSLKTAQYQIIIAIVLCLIHVVPFGIFQTMNSSVGCILTNVNLVTYYSYFYYPVLNGILPIFVASLFSILAYRNVRRIVRRQVPINRRKLDQQLTAMILVRVVIFVILLLPFTIYRIYSLHISINPTDLYSVAVYQLISSITISIVYLNHVVNFYIFFATSLRFRRQVKCFLIKKCWQKLKTCCHSRQNTVEPHGPISLDSTNETKE